MPSRIPRCNLVSPPPRRHAGTLLAVAAVTSAAFLVLLAGLHLLEPEFAPGWRFISEYQLGAWGPLMSVAFGCLAVSAGCLLVALRSQIRSVGGRVGLALLAVSAGGFALAAVFRTDSLLAPATSASGAVHSVAAVLGGFAPFAVLLLGWSLARYVAWRPIRSTLWWVAVPWIVATIGSVWQQAVIASAGGAFGPGVPVGAPNRILMGGIAGSMLSLAVVTLVALRRGRRATHPPVRPGVEWARSAPDPES